MQLSAEHDVSPYDAVYLALAEQTEFGLITADQKLYRRLRDRVSYATWIGDVERSA
jgi:predicted nucleic acid-binding protein